MSAAEVVVLVAAVVACVGAVVVLVAAWVLVGHVRRLERGVEALRMEAVPLVHEARRAAGHAASEMERVDAVLADTEAVTATVDHAARITQRALASPVVKVLAWRAGAAGAMRRLGRTTVAALVDAPAIVPATPSPRSFTASGTHGRQDRTARRPEGSSGPARGRGPGRDRSGVRRHPLQLGGWGGR